MIVFAIIAALLALGAAVWIARPLWQEVGGRVTAIVTVLVIGVSAAGLYLYSSQWTWPQQASAAQSPTEMVAQLARRLEREPENVDGWLIVRSG